jgi:hypothetical protein
MTAVKTLANVTLGSAASTVTFSSISGLHRDLYLVIQGASSISSFYPRMDFNSDSGSNYVQVNAGGVSGGGVPSSSSSGTSISVSFYGTGFTTTHQANSVIHVMDYSQTDKQKSVLIRTNVTDATEMIAARWASTAAITSVRFTAPSNSFAAGSTFTLYGISG